MPRVYRDSASGKIYRSSQWSVEITSSTRQSKGKSQLTFHPKLHYHGSTPSYRQDDEAEPLISRPRYDKAKLLKEYILDSDLPLQEQQTDAYMTNLSERMSRHLQSHSLLKTIYLTRIKQDIQPGSSPSFYFDADILTDFQCQTAVPSPGAMPPPLEDDEPE